MVQRAFGEDESERPDDHTGFPQSHHSYTGTAFFTWRCGLGSLTGDLRNRLAMNRFRASGLLAARLHETEL